ncbi:hypothetical protein BDA99DRAFT_600743 [Phascolomyces articulosus]|uniref:F-box domain-containing protein n=1 Tax=Phascolomyces articulosus TaxID=60185 RepID=A0AAD5PJM4_9FUNG|nr:hypothetical protein BDA99DRAFT_600743 [Phascolomyces articulosus]
MRFILVPKRFFPSSCFVAIMTGTKRKSDPKEINSSQQEKRIATDKSKWHHSSTTKKIKEILENGHTMQVINKTTCTIQDLQTEMLLILQLRAMAYAQKGRYEEELHDALSMMTFAPHDTAGYLYLGRRYAYQGYQKRAMDVLNKGLEKVSEAHPEYELLLEEKDKTQKLLDDRVDFFTCLPYDIACRIIDFTPADTVTHCSRVSSSWRSLVLNYPLPWRKIDASILETIDYKKCLHSVILLPSISHHVEVFDGLPYDRGYETRFLKLLQTNNFSNLCSLKMTCVENTQMSYHTLFCSALTSISGSLKSLNIFSMNTEGIPNVSQILSICHRLTSLRLDTRWMDHMFAPFHVPYSTHLTRIELCCKDEVGGIELQKFLQSSPNLRWFSVTKCNPIGFYETIQKYCPNLNVLFLGEKHFAGYNTEKWCLDVNQKEGLQVVHATLHLIGLGFIKLLEKHVHTLLGLSLGKALSFGQIRYQESVTLNSEFWDEFSTLNFNNLTRFILYRTALNSTRHHIGNTLKNMPNLEILQLEEVRDKLSSCAFNSIKKMHKLSELKIEDCHFDPIDLHQLLEFFVQNEVTTSSLHTLLLQGRSVDGTAMEISGQIKSLTTLIIQWGSRGPRPSVERFVKSVSQLPRLEQLILNDMELTSGDLKVLNTSISLRSVRLFAVHGITKEDMEASFSSNISYLFTAP